MDQPFATFRYYYLSWVQLHELKLIEVGRETVGEENDLSIIEPDEGSVRDSGDSAHQPSLPEDDSFHDCDVEAKHSVERQRPTLTTRVEQSTDDADKVEHSIYIPQDTIGQALSTNQRHSGAGTPPEYYRPSTSSSARPGAVSVDSDYSPTAYQPHPVFPGLTSDSNSGKPLEDVSGKSLLPVSRKQGGIMSGSSLADTISSIWTRRNNTTEARGRKETSKDGE